MLAQTTHTYRGGSGYLTAFTISGRTAHTFSDLLKRDSNDWASSLVVGVVTNNNDPDGMGRVRVKFPALGDNIEGWWARVATINAGQGPRPVHAPAARRRGRRRVRARRPAPAVRARLALHRQGQGARRTCTTSRSANRRFGVKSDHKVHLEGKQAITLRTGETLVIEVNRDGRNGTGDATLDAKGKIEISADQTVHISGVSGVTVESRGPLKLSGASVDINAVGAVNVSGAVINLG